MNISRILLFAIYLGRLTSVFGQATVAPPNVKGMTSLKNYEGIMFAADFAAGSATCGITEAIAAPAGYRWKGCPSARQLLRVWLACNYSETRSDRRAGYGRPE